MASDGALIVTPSASAGVPAAGPDRCDRREGHIALLIAFVALIAMAYRASVGVSLYDDTHYVTMALRIANGTRLFIDEMSLQSPGFLVPAAFAWLWTRTVGMTGLVLAYRMFYVVLACGTATIVYRALRGSFRPTVAASAALIPLMCPPFNLIAPSYNTMAMLGAAIAFASGYRALRDGGRLAPTLAGAGMAFAAVSYLPLSVAMLVLFMTLLALGRDRRLAGWTLLGAAAVLVPVLAFLVPPLRAADLQTTLAYASSNVRDFSSPLAKLGGQVGLMLHALTFPQAWAMCAMVVLASLPRISRWLRTVAFLSLPLAAAVPGLVWLEQETPHLVFGTSASGWLMAFTLGAALPVVLWARREHRRDLGRLLLLAAPSSVVGLIVVGYSTDAALARAVLVVGFVPLSIAVMAGWVTALDDLGGRAVRRVGLIAVLASVIVLLFATALDDGSPLTFHSRINQGAYAGMRMSAMRRAELVDLREAGRKYIEPGDRVTFLGERTGYLLVGGRPYTNAVWLYPGASDAAALAYFARRGAMPDVVFVDTPAYRKFHIPAASDPFLQRVVREYRFVDSVASFNVFVKR